MSHAKPGSFSKFLNFLATARGKTRNHKHLYDVISKSRYNAMNPQHKVKYRLSEEDGKYHLLPGDQWPHVIEAERAENSARQKRLNNNARAARLLKMQGPPPAHSLPRSRRHLPKSSIMTPTGSPLSPSTRRNKSRNTPEQNMYDIIRRKFEEYAKEEGISYRRSIQKLESYREDLQAGILDYIKEGHSVDEAFKIADVLK